MMQAIKASSIRTLKAGSVTQEKQNQHLAVDFIHDLMDYKPNSVAYKMKSVSFADIYPFQT